MDEDDIICRDTIKRRVIRSQNIVHRLFSRESGLYRKRTTALICREFYQVIFPNLTVINVEKPPGFLRKFSPDGKYLIAFSYDQTSLEIYSFQGTSAAAGLVNPCKDELVPNENQGLSYKIRSNIFNKLFKLKFIVNVSTLNKQLNRECSLFTNDGKYVIVGAACPISDENRPTFYEMYTTNEAMNYALEECSIYLVDLESGCVTNKIDYKVDKIFLSHNQGIYLYKSTFAVLSVLHQTISIFEIYNGKFMHQRSIGRFCCEPAKNSYNITYPVHSYMPFKEETINSLKHKFLTCLFRKAKLTQDLHGNNFEIRKFFQFFDQYKDLRMWKMQLIDENHILIKYTSKEIANVKGIDTNTYPAYFAFYNIPNCKVLAVYDNTSRDLLNLFENFCDMFRNVQTHSDTYFPCSPSNNIYSRLNHQKCKQTIIRALGGGFTEATKRLLTQLPISAQSYSISPYLDLNLFSYDDKWISVMERPKGCCEYPIRFFDRDSGLLKFRIYPGLQETPNTSVSRKLIAFTFHPTEPFAISVQRINNDYVVNFHIRNQSTHIIK